MSATGLSFHDTTFALRFQPFADGLVLLLRYIYRLEEQILAWIDGGLGLFGG